MSRAYPVIDGGQSSCFMTPQGGVISLTGNPPRLAGVERTTTTPEGTAFGPVHVAVPNEEPADEHTVVAIENLRFAPAGDDGSGGLLGLALVGGAAAARPPNRDCGDEPAATRRQVLGSLGATVAAASLTAGVSAADTADVEMLALAELDIMRVDAPVWIGLLGIIDDVLPVDSEVHLNMDGARLESLPAVENPLTTDLTHGDTVAAGETGTVQLAVSSHLGSIERLLVWANGILARDQEVQMTVGLETSPELLREGTETVLSGHPAIVGPAQRTGGSGAVVTIGGTSVPHADERLGKDRGHYEVRYDELVYVVGSDPPDGTTAELRFRTGRIAEVMDAPNRL